MKTSSKPKVDFAALDNEDNQFIAATVKAVKPDTKAATMATEAVVPAKKAAGRPANKRPSKQVPFHLPIDLLDRIDAAAENHFGSNKSRLVTKAIEKLLAELEA
jgi:hypothetical protein